MKVLAVRNDNGTIRADGGGDSAVLRPGEPVFIPEPVKDWFFTIAPAIRISRLGTHIPESKAGEYYESAGAVHLLLPAFESPVPPLFIDRAVAPPCEWAPYSNGSVRLEVSRMRPSDGSAIDSCIIEAASLDANRAVSEISKWITLKTGDVLVFTDYATEPVVTMPESMITVRVNNIESLNIKIK